MNPADPGPHLLLGRMLVTEGSTSPAVNSRLRRFLNLQPRNALEHYYYAMSLSNSGAGSSGTEEGD